jgi:hypothetical protein
MASRSYDPWTHHDQLNAAAELLNTLVDRASNQSSCPRCAVQRRICRPVHHQQSELNDAIGGIRGAGDPQRPRRIHSSSAQN